MLLDPLMITYSPRILVAQRMGTNKSGNRLHRRAISSNLGDRYGLVVAGRVVFSMTVPYGPEALDDEQPISAGDRLLA